MQAHIRIPQCSDINLLSARRSEFEVEIRLVLMSVLGSLDVTLSVKPLGQANYLLHCCRPIARILKVFVLERTIDT